MTAPKQFKPGDRVRYMPSGSEDFRHGVVLEVNGYNWILVQIGDSKRITMESYLSHDDALPGEEV